MAHISEIKGKHSELTARLALMSNGWTVATTDTDEAFDIVARDPINGEWRTFQVKSVRIRSDRNNEMVVYARKGNGDTYSLADVDYLIGVMETEGGPVVYMFENREISEYWCTEASAAERWVKLPIELDREVCGTQTAQLAA